MYIYIYNIFIHSFIDRHLGFFHILPVVNSTAVYIGVHVSFQIHGFVFFGYIPRNGIARSYDNSIFSVLRNLHTVFHRGCTNLHFNGPCMRVLYSVHPHQHVLFIDFLMLAILTGVRYYVFVVFIRISLIIICFDF